MGTNIEEDLVLNEEEFGSRLDQQLELFEEVIQSSSFGCAETTIGAELEASVVDEAGRACFVGPEIVKASRDPRVTVELDRFNLEYNLDPLPLSGSPFVALERDFSRSTKQLADIAKGFGARIVHVGILPTLRLEDVDRMAMTDTPRFRKLNDALCELRGEAFEINIGGIEPLSLKTHDVLLEGANTSMQIHLCVSPDRFADTYNACQVVTPIVLGLSTNSPTVLGHRLWKESRVALFKQSVDTRRSRGMGRNPRPRVTLGDGWVRDGAVEIFAESVALYPPLLPIISRHGPEHAAPGSAPTLSELRLHHGTVWRWNRAIYDPIDGGHLRIEMRALPAGPAPVDMVANAAFLLGLTLGVRDGVRSLLPKLPFSYVEYNFYRAAQHGMDAELIWPSKSGRSPSTIPLVELAEQLLDTAKQGLTGAGVDAVDAERALAVIAARIASRRSAADWQLSILEALCDKPIARDDAMHEVLERYLRNVASARPVHEWELT